MTEVFNKKRFYQVFTLALVVWVITFVWYHRQPAPDYPLMERPVLMGKFAQIEGESFVSLDKIRWQPIVAMGEWISGSYVRTSSSRVTAYFSDSKHVLRVLENSYVQFEQTPQEIRGQVIRGDLFLQILGKAKPYVLQMADTVFKTEDANLKISRRGDVLSATVYRGLVSFVGKGQSLQLTEGMSLQFFKGSLKITKEPFSIFNPQAYDTFYLSQKLFQQGQRQFSVRFAWGEVLQPLVLQIVKEKNDFSKPHEFVLAPQILKSREFVLPLEVGRYFWRLIPVEQVNKKQMIYGAASSVNELNIQMASPVVILAPLGEQKFSANDSILLRWANPVLLENLTVEFSRNDKFTDLILHKNLTSSDVYMLTQEDMESLGTSKIYWRVGGFLPLSSDLLYSTTSTFQIQ